MDWKAYLSFHPGGVRLVGAYFNASRVYWLCRRLPQTTLPTLLSLGLRSPSLPADLTADQVQRIVLRLSWLFGMLRLVPDTCLVRSVVAGLLLSDRPDVVLHIGFRPGQGVDEGMHTGHAWLTSAGHLVLQKDVPVRPDGDYREVTRFELRRVNDEAG